MNNFDNLTVVILTYSTSKDIIENCLKSINKNIKVIIIENSNEFIFRDEIQNEYTNIKIICTGKNLGYAGGNNFGLKLVETDFAFILNPDVICSDNLFDKIFEKINTINDFTIIGCQSSEDKNFPPAGYFEKEKNKSFINKFKFGEINLVEKVDWVTGCSIILNLKKFKNKKFFDDNYFLYFEEVDLCKEITDRGENVLLCNELRVNHLGFKSSLGENSQKNITTNRIREWHWMWSSFYFYKKNYGYFTAISKMINKFFKSLIKVIFFSITFQKDKRDKYACRLSGIFNSMIGKPSSFRG